MTDLFETATFGKLQLANRIVMAPLTRNRAGAGQAPGPLQATYYGQRASAGLIVTEGTQPSAVGQGYLNTPGMHSPEQIEGWRAVGDAVHAGGGQIVVQLMHAGRIAHPDNKAGLETIAPSPIAAPGTVLTPSGEQDYVLPRELATDELAGVVGDYVHASRSAIAAGLDGVELHGANGYLIHQFLADGANVRTDSYGGSPMNRARFAIEVATAVAEAIGPDRVGMRISPANHAQGTGEENATDVAATYGALVDGLAPLGLAYLHILADPRSELFRDLRTRFGGPVIVNDGFATVTDHETAAALLAEDLGDAVAVGRLFLANPDLPERWRTGAELNEPNPETFYGGDARGYTDYPALTD